MKGAGSGPQEPLRGDLTASEGIWRVPKPDESSTGPEVADLLHHHPAPWRLVERTNVVVDANGCHVVSLVTTTSNLEAIAEVLLAFVNYPRKLILGITEDA